jgi:hemolysin activation/secretion protein
LDAFGARHGTAVLPLSRDGAEPDFVKLEASGRYCQGFMQDSVQFSLAAKAQTLFGNALVASEQFGCGGFDWLSAYGGGAIQADTGAAVRAELIFPIILPALEQYPIFGALSPLMSSLPPALSMKPANAGSNDLVNPHADCCAADV